MSDNKLYELVLERCGYRDGAEATAAGSADNDLAQDRAAVVMQFIETAARHSVPEKLLAQDAFRREGGAA